MNVRPAFGAEGFVGRLHDGDGFQRFIGWQNHALGNFDQLNGRIASKVHRFPERFVELVKGSSVLQVEKLASTGHQCNGCIGCGTRPFRLLERRSEFNRCLTGFFMGVLPVVSCCRDAQFDGIGTVLNPSDHVELFGHGEIFTRANDVLELIQVVAGGRDGPLCAQVVAARQAKLGGHLHACLAGRTIHTAHEGGTSVALFEECDDAGLGRPRFCVGLFSRWCALCNQVQNVLSVAI